MHAVGLMDEDDEGVEPLTCKRGRNESAVASKRLEKCGPVAKCKKKSRVLVKLMVNSFFQFSLPD